MIQMLFREFNENFSKTQSKADGLVSRAQIIERMLTCPIKTPRDAIMICEAVIRHYGLDQSEQTMDAMVRDAMRAISRYLETAENRAHSRDVKKSVDQLHEA